MVLMVNMLRKLNRCFLAVAVVLLFSMSSKCSLISQSSIRSCQWGDSSEPSGKNASSTCKEKMVVSMTLMSDQRNTESLYANIRQAYPTGELTQASLLKRPFRIEVSKTETIASYRVYYRGSVNGRPSEHSIIFPWRDNCKDGWNDPHQSYPKQQRTDGTYEWDSQGFCCWCGSRREANHLVRPNAFCKHKDIHSLTWHGYIEREHEQIQMYGSSIHYMKMNDIWYDVFTIDMPILQYKVMVSLFEYNGVLGSTESGEIVANWTLLSSFELSPSKTVSRSPDGRVVARIEGELLGSQGPNDFSSKKLLIPSSRVSTKKRRRRDSAKSAAEWMLVDESLVDLSGKECNKIGTSFSAFRAQPMGCQREEGSCFSNQPLDLLEHDAELMKKGKTGKYLLHNYGQVHHSTHPDDNSFILRFVHTSLHNSFVTFDIDASDIQFVYNSVKGRIVDVTASDFTALEDNGLIVVDVENTGEIAGDFLTTLAHCHDDRVPSTKKRSISPGQIANISFAFQAFIRESEKVQCVVELYDVNYNLLGSSKVDLRVNVSCFCYGECGCACDSNGNITRFDCPEEPPVVIETGSIIVRLFLLILRIIGAHGIVGFFGGLLLVLGFVKLLFGGVICCRKTKAQKHYDEQIAKGVDPKAAKLVKCTGECRGARMAQARYKRKVARLRRMGKDPYRLDDWRNTSFVCNCNDELTDIRFVNIIRAVCFFYYCFFLPFIWLGRKLWWGVYRDTGQNKQAARRDALRSAKKTGKLEDLGMVDIGAELKSIVVEDGKRRTREQRELEAAACKSAKQTVPGSTARTEQAVSQVSKDKQNKTSKKKNKASALPKDKRPTGRGAPAHSGEMTEEQQLAALANVEPVNKHVPKPLDSEKSPKDCNSKLKHKQDHSKDESDTIDNKTSRKESTSIKSQTNDSKIVAKEDDELAHSTERTEEQHLTTTENVSKPLGSKSKKPQKKSKDKNRARQSEAHARDGNKTKDSKKESTPAEGQRTMRRDESGREATHLAEALEGQQLAALANVGDKDTEKRTEAQKTSKTKKARKSKDERLHSKEHKKAKDGTRSERKRARDSAARKDKEQFRGGKPVRHRVKPSDWGVDDDVHDWDKDKRGRSRRDRQSRSMKAASTRERSRSSRPPRERSSRRERSSHVRSSRGQRGGRPRTRTTSAGRSPTGHKRRKCDESDDSRRNNDDHRKQSLVSSHHSQEDKLEKMVARIPSSHSSVEQMMDSRISNHSSHFSSHDRLDTKQSSGHGSGGIAPHDSGSSFYKSNHSVPSHHSASDGSEHPSKEIKSSHSTSSSDTSSLSKDPSLHGKLSSNSSHEQSLHSSSTHSGTSASHVWQSSSIGSLTSVSHSNSRESKPSIDKSGRSSDSELRHLSVSDSQHSSRLIPMVGSTSRSTHSMDDRTHSEHSHTDESESDHAHTSQAEETHEHTHSSSSGSEHRHNSSDGSDTEHAHTSESEGSHSEHEDTSSESEHSSSGGESEHSSSGGGSEHSSSGGGSEHSSSGGGSEHSSSGGGSEHSSSGGESEHSSSGGGSEHSSYSSEHSDDSDDSHSSSEESLDDSHSHSDHSPSEESSTTPPTSSHTSTSTSHTSGTPLTSSHTLTSTSRSSDTPPTSSHTQSSYTISESFTASSVESRHTLL